ncbi:hypothetical protein [Paenibacillus ferrarius]|nr:hypothetical protein [Paenibacillus ferrarius]
MKNVNMVEFLIELQKQGVNVYLTPQGFDNILNTVKDQEVDSDTEKQVG